MFGLIFLELVRLDNGKGNLIDFIQTCIRLVLFISILLTVPRRCFFCGSFLLAVLHVGVCCAVVSVPCGLVVTCWERADLLAVVFVVFCHFPKCVLGSHQN